jgi:AraC-like DNA-binding protein
MRASDYQQLLARVDTYDLGETEKKIVIDAVRSLAREQGIIVPEHDDRLEFARRLRSIHEPRPAIRDRLMTRFGISRRQAYRVIHDSLQLCHPDAFNGTKQEENVINEEATTQE